MWDPPRILTDGDDCYASHVMEIFTNLRDLINGGLDDANIAPGGLTESGAPLVMDPTSGHTHDGATSRLPAFATDTDQGAIKWKQETLTAFVTDNFSADLNNGYMDTVLHVSIFWQTRAGCGVVTSGANEAIHTAIGLPGGGAPGDFWTTRHVGLREPSNNAGIYALVNPVSGGPDEVYIYTEYGSGADCINARVIMIGVDE